MSEKSLIMHSLLNKFLDEHFSDCSIQISETNNNKLFVTVSKENNFVFDFVIIDSSIFYPSISKDYYNDIFKLFELNDSLTESIYILNYFIDCLNENKNFTKIFKKLKHFNFSVESNFDSYQNFYESYVEDRSIELCLKFNNIKQHSILKFPFKFTNENKLKISPSITFLINQKEKISFGFNLKDNSIHLITKNGEIYENFFIENKILHFEKDIDKFVNQYVNLLLNDFKVEHINSELIYDIDTSNLDDKIALLNMLFI